MNYIGSNAFNNTSLRQGVFYYVSRSVAIIRPKKPFLHWLNRIPGLDFELSLCNVRADCPVIKISEVHEAEDGIAHIDELALSLFEMGLASWVADGAIWPQDRSLKMFWEWFDVEVHLEVLDSINIDIMNTPRDLH